VFVNCGGPRAKGFLGCSSVAAPLKGRVGGTSGCEEEVTVVEVDLDVLIVSYSCVLRPFSSLSLSLSLSRLLWFKNM